MVSSIVAIAAYGRAAGSARVRVFDWLDYLALKAQEVTYLNSSALTAKMLLRRPMRSLAAEIVLRRKYDAQTALLSRRASPLSNGRLEARLLGRAQRGIYDFDDALWLQRKKPFALKDVWQRSVEAADVVIAGNDFLADEARTLNENVVMIPSCVNLDQYTIKADFTVNTPSAVWIGSPSTEKYLSLIAYPLLALHADVGLRLQVVSAGDASLGALDVMVDRIQWHPETFGDVLAGADVGIMPLPNDSWSRGKCAYKILQYGAAALPVVASPVGANVKALSRLNGSSADSMDDWYRQIRRIVELPYENRAELGAFSREGVRAHYSFEAWETTWRRVVLGDD